MDALKLFQEYMGTGLIVLWFLVSLLYLWLTEKRKYIRVMFLYVPLVLLLVFFNPLVAKIVSQMADGEIYYRILWLLPVTPVIAFGTVQLYVILSEDKKLVGKMQDQEFEEFGRMHGYVIYKDSTVDLYYFMKE